jgi:malate synthase
LPKLESHLEARLWNEVIDFSEDYLKLKRGTVRCTVLIETILAAFEMEEILYVLRKHIVGLNCGRWDYIFSYIRAFQNDPNRLLPDRAQVTMDKAFLRAYSQLLIHTCHKRGAHAMGGMSAFIPIRSDAAANEAAMAKVRADKVRESSDGHDGTWVAHPGLVGLATEIFNAQMPNANQLDKLREDVVADADALLEPHVGHITESGVRGNLRVALEYIAAWLTGLGCVPIHNLMEDAATAEIARAQLWQWTHSGVAQLDDGRNISLELVLGWLLEESRGLVADSARFSAADVEAASALLHQLISDNTFATFLTLPAYNAVLARENLN